MCSVLLSYPFSVSLHLQPWWGWIRNPVPLQLRVQLVHSPALTLKLRLPNVQRLPNLWESLLGSLQALTYWQPAANSYKNSLHTAFILASSGIIRPVLIPCPCLYFLSPVVHFSTLSPGSPTPDRDLRWHPSQYGFSYLSHSCLTYT